MIKNVAIKMLASRMGWALKLVTGLIAGFVLPFVINTLGITLPPENQAEITAAIAGGVYILLQSIILKVSLDGSDRIQEELAKIDPRLNRDRWIGDVTIEALQKAIRQSTDVVERVHGIDVDDIPKATAVPHGRKSG